MFFLILSTLLLLFFANDIVGTNMSDEARGHARLGVYPFIDMRWCGLMSPEGTSGPPQTPSYRIVNGDFAEEGQFPWMASIHFDNKSMAINDTFLCGGVLVHRNWVLTAAHCVYRIKDIESLKVYLGSVDKYNFYNIYQVLGYDLHYRSDLALIRLRTEAFPEYMAKHFIINYICLPKPNLLNDKEELALVSGFGFSDESALKPSMVLRKAIVSIYPNEECLALNYSTHHICGVESMHMTCFGDSGSALVQFDRKRAVLIGIVSGGKSYTKQICGPGVLYYQRISMFIDWIAYVIERELMSEGLASDDKEGTNGCELSTTAMTVLWTVILTSLTIIFDIVLIE